MQNKSISNRIISSNAIAMLFVLLCPACLCSKAQTADAPSGVFSISPTAKVHFAPGNLQYQASTGTWRFAEHQWDYVGSQTVESQWRSSGGTVDGSDNADIASDYGGWIDLFGWGTGDNPTNTSSEDGDYRSFVEWGKAFGEGWRTLTERELTYLLYARNTNSGIRFAKASVNGVNGIILLTDNWKKATFSLNMTNKYDGEFIDNSISESVWNSTFAPAGAVFLPAAGHRERASVRGHVRNTVRGINLWGYYWLSNKSDGVQSNRYSYDMETRSSIVYFDAGDIIIESSNKGKGCCVRLVRPAK